MNYPIIRSNESVIRQAKQAKQVGRIFAIFGQPGCGKTQMAEDVIAPALGIPAENVFVRNFAKSMPSEVKGGGVPDMRGDIIKMRHAQPEKLPLFNEIGDAPAMLCLDEFLEYDGAIQSLFRSLFQPTDGRRPMVGTHELSANTFVMMTGNFRSHGSSQSSKPDAPIIGRSMPFIWEPSLDTWLDWAAKRGLANSPIYTFLKFQGLDQRGKDGDFFCPPVPQPWNGDAFPSPRQWAAACLLDDTQEDYDASLWSLVGENASKAAYAFSQTVAKMLPKLAAIRSGSESMPASDYAEQYALAHCAMRQAKRDSRDPEADVVSGKLDWLVDRVIMPCRGEIRQWAFKTAQSVGIPLNMHHRNREMSGI